MEKYSWSFDQYAECWGSSADSIEDCIYQAKEEADGEDTVYIGENIAFAPSVDAVIVLEAIEEQAGEFACEVGGEWDAYDHKTMRPALDELSEELTAIVVAWLKKYNREPNFYQVNGVKEYPLTRPAEEE